MLDTKNSVRDWAIELPQATRVFEKMGIDYCCGGGASLEDACASRGFSAAEVLQALDQAAGQIEDNQIKKWQSAPLSELTTHIIGKYHVFTRDETERLTALFTKVCSVHGQNHPELIDIWRVFKRLSDELGVHMVKEERVLFPYINSMEAAVTSGKPLMPPPFITVRNPVRMMSLEHDNAGELLRQMREASSDYTVPEGVCISYETLYDALRNFEEDLHQHTFLENNILFPRAIEMETKLNS
jgi:regulator of cell morphogenesis and NO signaling